MNLRTELESLAGTANSYADVDGALRLARRQRRRRLASAAVAVVLAIALVPLAAWGFNAYTAAPPANDPGPGGDELGLAMLVDPTHVRFGNGLTVELPIETNSPKYSLAMTPAGLVAGDGSAIYLIGENGETIDSTDTETHSWAVSDDGDRLGWSDGDTLHLEQITTRGFEDLGAIPLTEGSVVGGWAGDLVVLYESDAWMTLDTVSAEHSRRFFEPVRIYGLAPSGDLVGLTVRAEDGKPCLALFDPVTGSTKATRCEDEFFPETGMPGRGVYRLSPDGSTLFYPHAGVIVDVVAAFTEDALPQTACVAGEEAEWWNETTVVVRDGNDFSRCDFSRDGKTTELNIAEGGQLIPEHGR